MRILYLTEFLSSIGGGGELLFSDLAKEMARRGHVAHVICHQSEKDREIYESSGFDSDLDGLIIHRIRPEINLRHGYFPSAIQQLIYSVGLIIKGYKVVKENEIDVIHSNTLSPAFAGCLIGLLSNKPTVTTIHHIFSVRLKNLRNYHLMKAANSHDDNESNKTIMMTTHRLHTFLSTLHLSIACLPKVACEKIIMKLPVDILHAVSYSSRDDLISFGKVDKTKIVVVPNALDSRIIDHYVANGITSTTATEDNIEYQDFVLFVGRLVYSKNVALAIHSMSHVIRELPAAKLVIVGDGPVRKQLEEMVSLLNLGDSIKFTGYVSESRKREYLRKCSALVFPSLIEGFGLVILEAFAFRKPVIVPDVRPFDEIVSDGIDGFVIPTLVPREWANKIAFLLSNKSECLIMGTRGREKAKSMFRIESLAKRFEAIYIQCVDDRLQNDNYNKNKNVRVT